MRNFKKLGVLAAVLALSAIGAASASAASFTSTGTGALTGQALEDQVFTTNGGKVTCKKAATTGTISELTATKQLVTVKYSECTAYGFASVDISDAKYLFTSGGQVHIENTITITPTFFGASMCTVTVKPQASLGLVDYENAGASNVKVDPTVAGIIYESTGGSCGASGKNGTYVGANEISSSGNTLRFDK